MIYILYVSGNLDTFDFPFIEGDLKVSTEVVCNHNIQERGERECLHESSRSRQENTWPTIYKVSYLRIPNAGLYLIDKVIFKTMFLHNMKE